MGNPNSNFQEFQLMKVFFAFYGLIAVSLFASTIQKHSAPTHANASAHTASESPAHTTTRKALSQAKHVVKPAKNLAQLEHNLSQVQTQATFLNKLAQSLKHIQKFNAAVKDNKSSQTIQSLAAAFKHASTLAQSLVNTKKSLAQTFENGAPGQQTMLAQAESTEGIISLLKKAYHIIEQIK